MAVSPRGHPFDPGGWRRALVAAAVLVAVGVRAALATMTDPAGATAASTFTAAPDWEDPAVSASVGAKATGYLAGSVKQNGSYYVYANVSDTGAPASGVSTVTADLSNITTGATSVALVAGSYSANGISYNYRSAAQTASNPLSAGSKSWTLTITDAATNSDTVAGTAVTVDNTAPNGSDVQTANKVGGTSGKAEINDTITFTFSEAIDPESILSGWTGAATNVVVRLIDGGCLLNILVTICNDDSFQVWNATNSTILPFGTVDLNDGEYHGTVIGTQSPITYGASGTASSMVRAGATITVTLGTASATADVGNTTDMDWASVATPYDAAGNLVSTTGNPIGETGGDDREF